MHFNTCALRRLWIFYFLIFMVFYLLTIWHAGSRFLNQGSNSCRLQWKQSPNHWIAREVLVYMFGEWIIEQIFWELYFLKNLCGIEPMPAALEAWSLNHCTIKEVPRRWICSWWIYLYHALHDLREGSIWKIVKNQEVSVHSSWGL